MDYLLSLFTASITSLSDSVSSCICVSNEDRNIGSVYSGGSSIQLFGISEQLPTVRGRAYCQDARCSHENILDGFVIKKGVYRELSISINSLGSHLPELFTSIISQGVGVQTGSTTTGLVYP